MALMRVTEPFQVMSDINGRVYSTGDLVDESDPVVKGREHLFEPAGLTADRRSSSSVETATAAPGERRSVNPVAGPAVKPTKKAAVKPTKKAGGN